MTPDPLARLTRDRRWIPDTIGESGGSVWRLEAEGVPAIYLKHGSGRVARDIADEYARLEWLAPHGLAPKLLGFVRDGDEAWLLTEALPGCMAQDVLADEPERAAEVVRALAGFLRRLHALPVETCPFNARAPLRLAHARANIDAGRVPEDEFDAERQGWTAGRVWDAMHALLPLPFEEVVTHGDFSIGNLFLEGGEVTGCIDVGRFGVADPYQDLAILWNNLAEFDPALQAELWRAYSISEPDRRRLDFHLMLDEMF